MSKHPCEGCVDAVLLGGDLTCDYIGHTGHARSLICGTGAACIVKSTVPRSSFRQTRRGRETTWDVELAQKLYDQGLNDSQIAQAVAAKYPVYICHWRKRNKLPANAKQGRYIPEARP